MNTPDNRRYYPLCQTSLYQGLGILTDILLGLAMAFYCMAVFFFVGFEYGDTAGLLASLPGVLIPTLLYGNEENPMALFLGLIVYGVSFVTGLWIILTGLALR